MPILDTPITTDDRGIKKVLGQKQPAIVILHDGKQADKPLEDALKRAAKKHAGDLLVVRVDVNENGKTLAQYGNPAIPALVTLTPAFFGRNIKSQAEAIRPADVRAHIAHLLEDAPLPEAKPESAASTGKKPLDVTDSTFRKEVLKSKTPVLVDFWAPWCGPCRSIAPYVEQVAKDYNGKLKVVKLNVDQNPAISQRFQVRSIPTFMVFENGQPVNRTAGANPRAIQQLIGTVLQ